FGGNALQQRDFGADVIEVIDREADLGSSFSSSRLQFRAAGENEDQIRAEGAKGGPYSPFKASAVSEQKHDRGDAPGHAQHGEQTAPPVVAQRIVGLSCEIENHES